MQRGLHPTPTENCSIGTGAGAIRIHFNLMSTKSRNAIPLGSLPPKLRAQAEAQLGMQEQPAVIPTIPRALQPMKDKRIRQNPKPLMNGLETDFFNHLKASYPQAEIHAQAIRTKLANGAWYKSDFMVLRDGLPVTFYEVKGPKAFRGGFEFLKIAAHQYPRFKFILVWKANGTWKFQPVLP